MSTGSLLFSLIYSRFIIHLFIELFWENSVDVYVNELFIELVWCVVLPFYLFLKKLPVFAEAFYNLLVYSEPSIAKYHFFIFHRIATTRSSMLSVSLCIIWCIAEVSGFFFLLVQHVHFEWPTYWWKMFVQVCEIEKRTFSKIFMVWGIIYIWCLNIILSYNQMFI